jgi:hypothetical protein
MRTVKGKRNKVEKRKMRTQTMAKMEPTAMAIP